MVPEEFFTIFVVQFNKINLNLRNVPIAWAVAVAAVVEASFGFAADMHNSPLVAAVEAASAQFAEHKAFAYFAEHNFVAVAWEVAAMEVELVVEGALSCLCIVETALDQIRTYVE